ncbi:MAG: threonine/serine dehydratase [bacterium]
MKDDHDKTTLLNIVSARNRITEFIQETPLELSLHLSEKYRSRIFLKLENCQLTGSFKLRGAFNKILSLSKSEKEKGIITASAGNHGLGVAYAARKLGIACKIVTPQNASPAKIQTLQGLEVALVQEGNDYDEAEQAAWEIQKREGLSFIHAFSDPQIMAGQGTIALEIIEALPEVGSIVVPIGGGGLIAGVAVAAKALYPKIKVIGVQSEASPAMYNSLQAGKIVETPIAKTVADGLAGRFVTELTLNLTQQNVDEVVLVSESSIKSAMKMMMEKEHFIVEGSAAVGLAALLENKIQASAPVVLIVTGRNIDFNLLKKIMLE